VSSVFCDTYNALVIMLNSTNASRVSKLRRAIHVPLPYIPECEEGEQMPTQYAPNSIGGSVSGRRNCHSTCERGGDISTN
jgi:hypothetical protein